MSKIFGGLALCALGLLATGLQAQTASYPNKPIRLVVPYAPGGPLDVVARALAEKLKEPLGQPVLVDNKPGAGGNLGVDLVAKSAPDGHTLVIGAVATHAINPSLFPKMPFDPVKDFAPISLLAQVPNVLVMQPEKAQKLGIHNVQDLVTYAKGNPGKLDYVSGGNGSAGHLSAELFKSMAGVSMVHIPYNGAAPAQLSLIAGQTDVMFDNIASSTANIKGGKLVAFAVTTAGRSSAFPDLPTLADAGKAVGMKGFDISTWFGVFAPAGTPKDVVARLNTAIVAIMKSDDMRQRLARMGAEPAPGTPEQLGALVQSELQKYKQIVKVSGARVD